MDECPPDPNQHYSYISFVYDYNLAYENLFHRQVSDIDLYLFDEDGVYIQKLTDEAAKGNTFEEGYIMGLPEAYKDAVQFVAFPGLRQEPLQATGMVPGVSNIDELYVNLHSPEEQMFDYTLDPFWHGHIVYLSSRVEQNDTTVIPLKKNTNSFRMVFESLDEGYDVDIDEFSVKLTIANGAYDAYNQMADDNDWCYQPYLRENDTERGVGIVEMNTLRLLKEYDNRLTIRHEPTDDTLIDVNLNKYLNALRLENYSDMPFQEYLDREYSFKIIIFLKRITDGQQSGWKAARININGWEPRDQEGEL